jgi:prepilin-type N-terminal cleavage/methylation domain-containing protein
MKKLFLKKSAFTLIELLVVIGIIAVLSLVVILTLNPAELLRQSRDSNRLSDLSTMNSALSLYLTDVINPNLASSSINYLGCYVSATTNATTTAKCGVFTGAGITTNVSSTAANYRKVNSFGWLPVSFDKISIGSPFGNLPVDPTNSQIFYYSYAASTTVAYELDAFLESTKYTTNAANDGGSKSSVYEIGTNLYL